MTGFPRAHDGRRPDWAAVVIALMLAGLGALLIWEAGRLPDRAGYAGVGPDGMPRVVGWGLVILAVWTAIAAFRGGFDPRPRQSPGPVIWILAGLGGQLVLLSVAGFTIASAVLFACTAAAFGKRNFAVSLPAGLIMAFAVYVLFDRVLGLNLPSGPIETLILGG